MSDSERDRGKLRECKKKNIKSKQLDSCNNGWILNKRINRVGVNNAEE